MSIQAKQPKPKTCKNPACRASFVPQRLGQAVCSPKCALATVEAQKAKEKKSLAQVERRDIKVRKEKLKSRADHAKEAQVALNAYVRERDRDLPCISCGITYPEGRNDVWDAGHLRSVGASPATRFNLFNVNKQCVRCNRYLSSNAVLYKASLIKKIGIERVEKIYSIQKGPAFSVEYLVRLKAIFRKRLRVLKIIRERSNRYVA